MRAGLAIAALAVASLSISACAGSTHPCCCNTTGTVALPPGAVAPIDRVSTDLSCAASDGGGAPGARFVNVKRWSAGSCQVQVVLTDGQTYTFTIEFATFGKNAACDSPLGPVDASVPELVDAGFCHGPGAGTAGTGGMSGAGGTSGATSGTPACAGLTTASGVAPTSGCVCMPTDPRLCGKPCGPDGQGTRSETCTDGIYAEAYGCNYDMGKDYSCYALPTVAENPACQSNTTEPPKEGTACAVDHCVVCNSSGGLPGGIYIDRSGSIPTGYCVCSLPDSAGNRTWSCALDTQWPCPAGSGC